MERNKLVTFLAESIKQDPTIENVKTVFATVRVLYPRSVAEDLIRTACTVVVQSGTGEMIRAIRKGEMEPRYVELARSVGHEAELVVTAMVPRPDWLTTEKG